jgi:hypothetical protein
MKRASTLVAALCLAAYVSLALTGCSTLTSLANSALQTGKAPQITNDEAVQALRDALKAGIEAASKALSKTDGYFADAALKILLPPDAKNLVDNVSKIPQGKKLVDDVVLRLNRSAEEAAGGVVSIFVNAISGMSVSDGIAIVRGSDSAATDYLRKRTYDSLFNLFKPKVDEALGKPLVGGTSAKRAWEILVNAYNAAGKLPNEGAKALGKSAPMPPIDVDLARYATGKALDGLFSKIAEEEKKIRQNPLGYASKMIQKVFGARKDGRL